MVEKGGFKILGLIFGIVALILLVVLAVCSFVYGAYAPDRLLTQFIAGIFMCVMGVVVFLSYFLPSHSFIFRWIITWCENCGSPKGRKMALLYGGVFFSMGVYYLIAAVFEVDISRVLASVPTSLGAVGIIAVCLFVLMIRYVRDKRHMENNLNSLDERKIRSLAKSAYSVTIFSVIAVPFAIFLLLHGILLDGVLLLAVALYIILAGSHFGFEPKFERLIGHYIAMRNLVFIVGIGWSVFFVYQLGYLRKNWKMGLLLGFGFFLLLFLLVGYFHFCAQFIKSRKKRQEERNKNRG